MFKEFDDHLEKDAHRALWRYLPNLTAVVLEREVNDQWKSKYVAEKTKDWTFEYDSKHKQKVQTMHIPPLNEVDAAGFCDPKAHAYAPALCKFEERHVKWYEFVRTEIFSPRIFPNRAIFASFNDIIERPNELLEFTRLSSNLP